LRGKCILKNETKPLKPKSRINLSVQTKVRKGRKVSKELSDVKIGGKQSTIY
jgi:hypothetical protein